MDDRDGVHRRLVAGSSAALQEEKASKEENDLDEEDSGDSDDEDADVSASLSSSGHFVNVVGQLTKGMTERTAEMKEAFNRGTDRLYHAITANNKIVLFRIGVDGSLIFERTVKSIRLHRNKFIDAGKQVPIAAQKKMRKVITGDPNKRIRDHMREVPQVKLLDKLSFSLGVAVITFTEYLMLRHPEWFVPFYVGLMLFMFVARYFMYKPVKHHFFMLDFCYLVNISCMVHALWFPDNPTWFKANYALAMGPLSIAIIMWRNSLVFHSLDKLTSFFLHAFPPVLYHLFRWGLIPTKAVTGSADDPVSFKELFLPAIGMYIAWQIAYLFLTEYVFKETLDADPELITSSRFLTRDKKNALTNRIKCGVAWAFTKIVGRDTDDGELDIEDSENAQTKLTFLAVQFVYTSVVLMPSYFMYSNYFLSCAYFVVLFIAATWNGASYYIEVFSKRYNLKFENRERTKSEATDVASERSEEVEDETVGVGDGDEEDESSGAGGEDEFVEAAEDLNESQTRELIKLLESVDETDGTGGISKSEGAPPAAEGSANEIAS